MPAITATPSLLEAMRGLGALVISFALVAGCAPRAAGATARTICPAPIPTFSFGAQTPADSLGRMFSSLAQAAGYQRCLAEERRERASAAARIAQLEREVAELRAAARSSSGPAGDTPAASPNPYDAPPNPYDDLPSPD